MKKSALILSLLSVFALGSCDNSGENTTTTQPSLIEYNLSGLRQGFAFDGTVNQSRILGYVDADGNFRPYESSTEETSSYDASFVFQNNNGLVGYHKETTQEYLGAVAEMENYTYFCDEEGYAYQKELNYQNEVIDIYPTSYGRKIPYNANGFYNPFLIIGEEDIIQNRSESNRFDLNLDKAGIIAENLLYSLNVGFYGTVAEAYFTLGLSDYFESFTITMNPRVGVEVEEGDDYENLVYRYNNTVTFNISDVSIAAIETVTQIESKQNYDLQNALDKIDDNFTLTVADSANENDTSSYLFDGSSIYVHHGLDGEVDLENDYYLAQSTTNPNGTLYSYYYDSETSSYVQGPVTEYSNAYQGYYYYKDYLPIVSGISADLFTYDKDNDFYVSDAEAITALSSCFGIQSAPFRNSNASSATLIAIRLNDNNEIDYVGFAYSYMDETGSHSGVVAYIYSNIGTTENPAL